MNGSRRQAPNAGRNKYMGNIWQGIGHLIFRHADPEGPARRSERGRCQARPVRLQPPLQRLRRQRVFRRAQECSPCSSPPGRWYATLEGFRRALAVRGSIGDPGEVAAQPPLRDAANHDFRPTAAAYGKGVRVFVPWGLYATVGEWDFYHAGNDPTLILDDHFHMAPYYVGRDTYYKNPMYHLRTVNVKDEDFVQGPLEDWTRGALEAQRQEPIRRARPGLAGRSAAAGRRCPRSRTSLMPRSRSRRPPVSSPIGPPRSSCGCMASSRA